MVRFLVSLETMHPARHPHPAQGLAPGDGISLAAGRRRKRVGRFGAPADKAVNPFLDVDKRLFHSFITLARRAGQSKARCRPGGGC